MGKSGTWPRLPGGKGLQTNVNPDMPAARVGLTTILSCLLENLGLYATACAFRAELEIKTI